MYWRDYDVTFKADDVVWAGFQPSADSLILDITDSNYIESNLTVIAVIADITPTLTSEKTIGLFGEQTLNPKTIELVYIESETKTSANIYPTLVSVLEASLLANGELVTDINNVGLIGYNYGDDNLQPILIDQAAIIPLQDTILKRLGDNWAEATIYLKESDGSWSSKPIYMKQIDKSWM